MLGCVLAGLGVSVTSRMVVEPYLHRGELETVPIDDLHMTREFYIVYHRKRELFPATQKLIAFLTSVLKNNSDTSE